MDHNKTKERIRSLEPVIYESDWVMQEPVRRRRHTSPRESDIIDAIYAVVVILCVVVVGLTCAVWFAG